MNCKNPHEELRRDNSRWGTGTRVIKSATQRDAPKEHGCNAPSPEGIADRDRASATKGERVFPICPACGQKVTTSWEVHEDSCKAIGPIWVVFGNDGKMVKKPVFTSKAKAEEFRQGWILFGGPSCYKTVKFVPEFTAGVGAESAWQFSDKELQAIISKVGGKLHKEIIEKLGPIDTPIFIASLIFDEFKAARAESPSTAAPPERCMQTPDGNYPHCSLAVGHEGNHKAFDSHNQTEQLLEEWAAQPEEG